MLALQHFSYMTHYPSWLLSTGSSIDYSSCSDGTAVLGPAVDRLNSAHILTQRLQWCDSLSQPHSDDEPLQSSISVVVPRLPWSGVKRRSPVISLSPHSNHTPLVATPSATNVRRVALPLPFSKEFIANTVHFHSRGQRGISLSEWARLSEKRKTYVGIDDPHESVDELFPSESRMLFQSHWPGYDTRTCYLDIPAHVTQGERAFTRVNLLDMVSQSLVEWVLRTTNSPHIECREPKWTIGLQNVTFKHIYVVSVVEVKGYVAKWVPILEIDSQGFRS